MDPPVSTDQWTKSMGHGQNQLPAGNDATLSIFVRVSGWARGTEWIQAPCLQEGHRNRLTSHQKRQQISFYGHAKDSTVTSWPSITTNPSELDFYGANRLGELAKIYFLLHKQLKIMHT